MTRNRAFRPEALGRLEDRLVLSHAGAPAVLSGLGFNTTLGMIRNDFELFATSGDFERLRSTLAEHVANVPFQQADGLGPKINAALDRMQADLASGVPHAVASAHQKVVRVIKSDVRARIEDGSIRVTK
jgi:hypothetical protein